MKTHNRIKQAIAMSVIGLGIMAYTAPVLAAEAYYTLENVNLRSQPSTQASVLYLVESGKQITVTEYDANGWSKVVYNDLNGYIKSEFIVSEGKALAGTYYTIDNVNFRSKPSTDSEILALIKTGTPVTVTEYNADEWSKVTFNDKEGFIKSEYLGTQAETAPQPSTVELTPWSEARNVFKIGEPAKVYDVYTGITYYVKSFSNGKHADVEPVTTNDTELMKKAFGGVWSWDVRPVWVTVGGKTMAASINGMPHGGGVNNSNGMNGQICIHFKDSSTHNGNASYTKLHQDKAQEAYNLSK